MKKIKLTAEQKYNLHGYIFLIPWFIGFTVCMAFPFFLSVVLSLTKVKNNDFAAFELVFVGFENYVRAFIFDVDFVPMFLNSVADTLIKVPLIIVYSLFIAIILNSKIKFKGLFRVLFFLPVLIGSGYIMQALTGGAVHQDTIQELSDSGKEVSTFARGIVLSPVIYNYLSPSLTEIIQNLLDHVSTLLWHTGIQIIIFLGGLQSIPRYLYEAADVDGASSWEQFWKITLPMLTPVILINIVFSLVDYFTSIDNEVMNYTLASTFETGWDVNYGSALGWIYFVFIFLLIGIVFLLMRKRVQEVSSR